MGLYTVCKWYLLTYFSTQWSVWFLLFFVYCLAAQSVLTTPTADWCPKWIKRLVSSVIGFIFKNVFLCQYCEYNKFFFHIHSAQKVQIHVM